MKTLFFSVLMSLIGYIIGASMQYAMDHRHLLNLGNQIIVFQDGEPTALGFNDELLLRPGAKIEIIGAN